MYVRLLLLIVSFLLVCFLLEVAVTDEVVLSDDKEEVALTSSQEDVTEESDADKPKKSKTSKEFGFNINFPSVHLPSFGGKKKSSKDDKRTSVTSVSDDSVEIDDRLSRDELEEDKESDTYEVAIDSRLSTSLGEIEREVITVEEDEIEVKSVSSEVINVIELPETPTGMLKVPSHNCILFCLWVGFV